jgi:predicted transcriptional regulator
MDTPQPVESTPTPPAVEANATPPAAAADPQLTLKQKAYLIYQLADAAGQRLKVSDATRKVTEAAKTALGLAGEAVRTLREALTAEGLMALSKEGRTAFIELTEKGRQAIAAGLPRPEMPGMRPPVDEASFTDAERNQQRGFVLLQLVGNPLTRAQANERLTENAKQALGLTAEVANRRRQMLAEQGYLRIVKEGRNERYELTPNGEDYVAAMEQPEEFEFKVTGRQINALLNLARNRGFAAPAAPEGQGERASSAEDAPANRESADAQPAIG